MPTATRRQVNTRPQSQLDEYSGTPTPIATDEIQMAEQAEPNVAALADTEIQDIDLDGEGSEEDVFDVDPFPPPGLKEISSLASWTVSSAKPGNGVRALRSSDTAQFWQSDGPQPHLLSIHFFKLVSIVHMRIYLDFSADESYTPTKIQFLAGMGVHDIQEFAEMSFDQPLGWIDVDFTRVGKVEPDSDSDDNEDDIPKEVDWSKRPVLRAFLVQVRILENHQNGKDTHLRAVQLFARDQSQETRKSSQAKPLKDFAKLPLRTGMRVGAKPKDLNNIKLASWMQDPDMR